MCVIERITDVVCFNFVRMSLDGQYTYHLLFQLFMR